ncbi:DUF551 domain-containing protein [Escherichia coli]|nr:DUF551 domain-containing protein [Escherichia coli]EHO4881313.1 DUF551 domain-containing protein [Escherichia coli]
MTTITKERLLTIRQWRETYGPGSNVVLPAEEAEELARIALASLEAEPIGFRCRRNDNLGDWGYVYHREPDDFEGKHLVIESIYAAPPVPVVPEEMYWQDAPVEGSSKAAAYATGWNACRTAMLHAGNFRENANSSTNNFREIAETSTNSPVIPGEVLSAILKFARVRADFDDFDGDRRGIGDCLDEAEQEIIVTINKYASQLATEPIAPNDVREQTAVPPVPVIQADVAQSIENLKQKLVECNRYNYCADAVKGVEDACLAAMLQSQGEGNPHVTPDRLPGGFTIEDAKALHEDLVRSHISQALSGEKMKKKDRDADLRWIHGVIVQAAWFVKASLEQNALSGNSPVTPDSWISCSERMPAQDDWILIYSKHGEYMAGQVQGEYVELSDGTLSWLGNALFWGPLPEPPKEVRQ